VSVKSPNIRPYGDSAVLIDYETPHYSDEIYNQLSHLAERLRQQDKWIEIVPSYKSLLVVIDVTHAPQRSGKIIEVPVVYGGEYGPDMDVIKKASGLSESEIIDKHSGQDYKVCMMGFIPGFCFLSEVPAILQHPRHDTPRAHVEAGSVGIAGWQTGIYGLGSPGGWQIIGRTPLTLFDPSREVPFLMEAGDTVRFIPSSKALF
jgi:allophanate hydrolase subunit 1